MRDAETVKGIEVMKLKRALVYSTVITAVAGITPMLGGALVPAAAVSSAACDSITVDRPHYSAGAGGIIAKGKVSGCGSTARVYELLSLWLCPSNSNPPDPITKSWEDNHCTPVVAAHHPEGGGYFNPSGTGTDVRYVPRQSEPGAHGTGIWIAENTWGTKYTDYAGVTRHESGDIFNVSAGVISG